MDRTFWYKQTLGDPLFPDLSWSRPENKAHAGKLLVIGGNSFGFAAVGEAYEQATRAGVGTIRVLLPNALQKFAGMLPNGEFAPSTPSGSFGQKSLADWLEHSTWADGVLIAGDLARNSETAIVLEKFLHKYQGMVTLTKDTVDYVTASPKIIQDRPDTLLILSFAQLQKLGGSLKFETAFTHDMDLLRLVDALHEFTTRYGVLIVTKQSDTLYIAVEGQVSTTPDDREFWRVKTAAGASTWWLQNPEKPFEAITSSVAHL